MQGGGVMRKLLVIAFVFVLVLGIGGKAWALSYSGTITGTGDDGLFGTDGWDDATLSWAVDDTSHEEYWTYNYTFDVNAKSISHFIFEVSENFTAVNINQDFTTSGWQLDTYSSTAQGQSNPGIPEPLYGIKWDTLALPGEDVRTFSVTLVSDREPMWGDFYAKDGKVDQGQLEVYAYNTGFLDTTSDPIDHGNAGGWVLVPDTASIPEPATLLLLGSGFLGLALLSRKRSRTKS